MRDQKNVKISKLKSHPFQNVYLNEPDHKIDELAADIEKNGQRLPIEISQDHEIIDGHCRLEAIKKLGRKTILAVVVEVENEMELRRRHLEANINRRHLERIDQVRLIKAQLDLDNESETFCRDELRLRIAKAFGQDKSDPTVRRYLRLVHLPDLIQELFKRRQLRLMTALKFDTLDEQRQEELLELIKQEEMSPAAAFDNFFDTSKQTRVDSTRSADIVESASEDAVRDDSFEELTIHIFNYVKKLNEEIHGRLDEAFAANEMVKRNLDHSKLGIENAIAILDADRKSNQKFRKRRSQ